MDSMRYPLTRKAPTARKSHGTMAGTVVALGGLGVVVGAASRPHLDVAAQVSVKLSEWNVALSQASIAAGPVTFVITNAGSIPHGFEVEGQGLGKEIETIQPGARGTLTPILKTGSYDRYCSVGGDSHQKVGVDL